MDTFSALPTQFLGPEPPPGARIGSFELLKKIGQGGMGQVWKAKHQASGESYAIKLLPFIIAQHPDAWDQVLGNFQIVKKLNHQHICPLNFLDRDPQWGPYLVMPFIEGISLAKYRRRKETFSPEEVAKLLKPVADALDYAHGQKVIHRDIKHDNILLTLAQDGETITGTFVIDFGLAAQVRSTVSRFSQQSPPLAGTRPFMAPELWKGRPPVPQSDQYALGVIAYELLAGFYPFDNDDVAVLRESVLNDSAEPIADAGDATNAILAKALLKEHAKRHATCSDFIDGVATKVGLSAPQDAPDEIVEFIPKERPPAPRLEVPRIIDELITLSRPNGILNWVYTGLLEESQREYWHELSAMGDLDAAFLMAVSQRNTDSSSEVMRLEPMAQQGHVLSMWRVGDELSGRGYDKPTYEDGIAFLEQALSAGLQVAKCDYANNLDCDFDDEDLVERHKQLKLEIYEELSDADFPPAMVSYANLLLDNISYHTPDHRKERTIRQATRLLIDAAKMGSYNAASALERRYRTGRGLPQSGKEASFWDTRKKELSRLQYKCPSSAFGIDVLNECGWISEFSKRNIFHDDSQGPDDAKVTGRRY